MINANWLKENISVKRDLEKWKHVKGIFNHLVLPWLAKRIFKFNSFWRLGTKSEENFPGLSNKFYRERLVAKTKSINKKKIEGTVSVISNGPLWKDGNARFPFLINTEEDIVVFFRFKSVKLWWFLYISPQNKNDQVTFYGVTTVKNNYFLKL